MSSDIDVPWRVPNPLTPNHSLDQTFILRIVFAPLSSITPLVLLLTIIAVTFILVGIFTLKISSRETRFCGCANMLHFHKGFAGSPILMFLNTIDLATLIAVTILHLLIGTDLM